MIFFILLISKIYIILIYLKNNIYYGLLPS